MEEIVVTGTTPAHQDEQVLVLLNESSQPLSGPFCVVLTHFCCRAANYLFLLRNYVTLIEGEWISIRRV